MAYAEHALNALWAEAAAQILQQGGKDGGRLTSSGEAGGFGGRGKGGGGDGSGSLLPRPLWLATWRACSCVASLGGALTLLASATAAAGSGPPPRQGAALSSHSQQAGGGELVLVSALLAFLHRVVRSPLPGAALPLPPSGQGLPSALRAAAGGEEEGSGAAAMAEIRIRIMEAVQCSCRSLAQAAGVSAAVRGLLVAPPAWRAGASGGGDGADGLPDASSLAEAVLRECEAARRAAGAAGGGSK